MRNNSISWRYTASLLSVLRSSEIRVSSWIVRCTGVMRFKRKRLLAILLIHTSAFLVNAISSGGNIRNCFRGTFSLCNLLPAHLESFLLPLEC